MTTAANLNYVKQPISTARGLPNEHYVSNEKFDQEKQAVLFNNWSGIGFGKDIPEPGDALPVNFVGMPLLLVRDHEGQVNVFQNTCRHRGMILVEEKTKIRGAIRCPYHSWCYGLKGELRTTPHVGGSGHNTHEDIKPDELGLFRIRSHVWHDIIFVNIAENAAPFEEYASDVMDRWSEFQQPMYHGGEDSSFKFEVDCNWKLAVENYCESYHLPWVHPGLNSYSRLEDHYDIYSDKGSYSGQGSVVYRQLTSEGGDNFVDFEGLSEKWNTSSEYISLFPNVLLGIHRDHFFAIVLQPTSNDHTIEHVELYYASEEMQSENWVGMRNANARLWHTVFSEDVFVVEGMQRGRHGIKFDGGKFSPAMDGATHAFHQWVANQYG